ncbi:MAG: hypothetical protein IJZ62_04495 [Clostridia bacterium]|nr:hypothetical protein [Clostridia bacterium]
MNRPINIVLVSLNEKFCKSVGENLADSLEMFSANCEELIIYDMINPKEVIEKCGIEYFRKRERDVVRNCSEYEDNVLSVSYNLFKSYHELFNNSLIICIRLPKGKQDKVPNEIDYQNRDDFLSQNSHINISLEQKSIKKCNEFILKKMGEYYENC